MDHIRRWPDLCGIGLSLGCGLHCIALAALLVATPGAWLRGELFGLPLGWWRTSELVLTGLALGVASTSLFFGWRRHRRWWLPVLGLTGSGLIAGGTFLPVRGPWVLGIGLVVCGGLVLAASHWINLVLTSKRRLRVAEGAEGDRCPSAP